MTKRNVTEIVEEYDESGNLIRKTTTETHEEEDPSPSYYPSYPTLPSAWWGLYPPAGSDCPGATCDPYTPVKTTSTKSI